MPHLIKVNFHGGKLGITVHEENDKKAHIGHTLSPLNFVCPTTYWNKHIEFNTSFQY